MANRMKEDEKNEKIIRGLLKLTSNRRCINCNSLGPQYVCTNFWTFVCTTCSGIHREFTHRIKSVSMAKFSSQEVNSLQGGGNERAKEIYFKEWDPQRHSVPDSINVEKLRDFIKHVYVDRRYTGERSIDKPPRVKMGEKEDSFENKRVDTYQGGSRSPQYEDKNDRHYSERSGLGERNDDKNYRYNYYERRSPGYDQETRSGDYKRSPARFEVVNDWHRDDRYGNGRRFEHRFSDGESKLEGRSPNSQKDLDMPSPPMVRPIRDILGEDAPPLRISEPPKANGAKVSGGSAYAQRTASSSSLGSIDAGSVELKRENSGSLIDFNADYEPSDAAAVSPVQPITLPVVQSVTQPITSPSIDGGNWASFDLAPQPPAQTQAPSNANTLESLLFQLSAPASAPVGNMSVLSVSGGAPTTASFGDIAVLPISNAVPTTTVGNISTLPFSGGVAATPAGPNSMMSTFPISGAEFLVKANDGRQWTSMQLYPPSTFPTTESQSTVPQFTPSVSEAQNNQPWNSSLMQNLQGPLATAVQPSQAISKPTLETSAGVIESQPTPLEAKNSGRQELLEDLFTATYSTVPVPVPGWHPGPSHGMGFGNQYPNAVSMPTFPDSSKSTNPFDLNNEPTLVHAPTFPSMMPLQGALPNMAAPPGSLHTSSFGTHSPRWVPPQSSSYAAAGHSPYYASALPPSAYAGHQIPSNEPSLGHQGSGGFGGKAAFLGTLSTDQQLSSRISQSPSSNPFSSLGATLPGHF